MDRQCWANTLQLLANWYSWHKSKQYTHALRTYVTKYHESKAVVCTYGNILVDTLCTCSVCKYIPDWRLCRMGLCLVTSAGSVNSSRKLLLILGLCINRWNVMEPCMNSSLTSWKTCQNQQFCLEENMNTIRLFHILVPSCPFPLAENVWRLDLNFLSQKCVQ